MERDEERARREFTSEAEELLDGLARDLAELDEKRERVRPEVVNSIFRSVHSLKGLAGMLGFESIGSLSHSLEELLDKLRLGKVAIESSLVDLLLECHGALARLIGGIATSEPSEVDVESMRGRIRKFVTVPVKAGDDPLAALDLDEQTRRSLTEYEEHRLVQNLTSGRNLLSLTVHFDFSDFDEKLRALTESIGEQGEVISTLPTVEAGGGSGISFRLLVGTDLSAGEISSMAGGAAAVTLRRGLPFEPAEEGTEGAEELSSLRSLSQSVRVDIARLDQLMNLVGELVLDKGRLQQILSDQSVDRRLADSIGKIVRSFERRLKELQQRVVEVRLVPMAQLYARVTRTARKLARELAKEVEISTSGAETQLDKMMIEELADPLMHVIRNALDHGLESKQERLAAGKPAAGQIGLRAFQQGNSVLIEVSDDGDGIRAERVREAALKRGLISEKEEVGLERAIDLIFSPGFSTAATVSEVSGRGVGLDVVRQNIQKLKGSIEVITEPGSGTTFRISLPITLAVIQSLIVRVGSEPYAVPLSSVQELLRIRADEIVRADHGEVYLLRNINLPLLRLSDAFGVESDEKPSAPYVLVARVGERLAGLVVDEVLRQQEIVVKSVGERLKGIAGLAGATEIGENEIAIVVDTNSLLDRSAGAIRAAGSNAPAEAGR